MKTVYVVQNEFLGAPKDENPIRLTIFEQRKDADAYFQHILEELMSCEGDENKGRPRPYALHAGSDYKSCYNHVWIWERPLYAPGEKPASW